MEELFYEHYYKGSVGYCLLMISEKEKNSLPFWLCVVAKSEDN